MPVLTSPMPGGLNVEGTLVRGPENPEAGLSSAEARSRWEVTSRGVERLNTEIADPLNVADSQFL